MRRGAKALLILGVSIPAALFDDGRLFLFVPVLINAALLVGFGRTLVNGPSMVETFARLRGRDLSTEEVVYCRIVTGVARAVCEPRVVDAVHGGAVPPRRSG